MSLRKWLHRASTVALVVMLVGCGGGSSTPASISGGSGSTGTTGSSGGTTGGSNPPAVTGVSTPKSVSVVTAN